MTSTRLSAEERRDDVLDAALIEFAERGLVGTSTEDIARRAGISQPYLFRLFGTKKALFTATVTRCFRETLEMFQRAAEGKRGEEALHAMGQAYTAELISGDRVRLRRKNLIKPKAMPYLNAVGMRYDSGTYEANLDLALKIADAEGFMANVSGVEPSTRLSSASSCVMIRRLSEMWSSGVRRSRMFAEACDWFAHRPPARSGHSSTPWSAACVSTYELSIGFAHRL